MKNEKTVQDFKEELIPLLKDGKSIRLVVDLLSLAGSMEPRSLSQDPPPPPPDPEQRPKPGGEDKIIKNAITELMNNPGSELSNPSIRTLILELLAYSEKLANQN